MLAKSWGGERFGTKVALRSAAGGDPASRVRNHEIFEKIKFEIPTNPTSGVCRSDKYAET